MRINHAALKALRVLSGFSQSALAEMAQIDRPNYAHIEAGRRRGTAAQLRALANALNVPPLALMAPEPAEIGRFLDDRDVA
jgi:transcriptional regulator with XRE-family HTH domain